MGAKGSLIRMEMKRKFHTYKVWGWRCGWIFTL